MPNNNRTQAEGGGGLWLLALLVCSAPQPSAGHSGLEPTHKRSLGLAQAGRAPLSSKRKALGRREQWRKWQTLKSSKRVSEQASAPAIREPLFLPLGLWAWQAGAQQDDGERSQQRATTTHKQQVPRPPARPPARPICAQLWPRAAETRQRPARNRASHFSSAAASPTSFAN